MRCGCVSPISHLPSTHVPLFGWHRRCKGCGIGGHAMIFSNERESIWDGTLQTGEERRSYHALRKNLTVDVAVVGAGVAGLTTAYMLARSGKRVAVLEAGHVAGGESSRSTAHLTHVYDTLPQTLVSKFDESTTKA